MRRSEAPDHSSGRLPRGGLLILASAIFLSMTTEFLPGGLIPGIADTFDRPVAEVGQLITVFAAAVIVATTPLAAATRRVGRKPLAIIALSSICASAGLAAFAPTFELLVASRIAGGAANGLFWAVAAAYAADLVPLSQLGRATAITAAGGSLASVLGIPVGNALGQAFGWRAAFLTIALVGVVIVILVVLLLPPVPSRAQDAQRSRIRSRIGIHAGARREGGDGPPASTMPRIVLLCGIILLVVIGQTTFGTYFVVWLEDVAQLPPAVIPLYLLGSGAASLLAVTTIGRFADRFPNASVAVATAGGAVLMACLPFAVGWGLGPIVALALMQGMCFAVVPVLLQTRMMRTAAPHQRTSAAALQTTAINVAIGGGALLGGLVVSGLDLSALPWVAAAITTVGLGALLLSSVNRARTAGPQIRLRK